MIHPLLCQVAGSHSPDIENPADTGFVIGNLRLIIAVPWILEWASICILVNFLDAATADLRIFFAYIVYRPERHSQSFSKGRECLYLSEVCNLLWAVSLYVSTKRWTNSEYMGMTEYEIADLAASVLSNFLTSLTVFLSIVSAYVISAFGAGKRLTKIQLSIINLCFVVSVGILGFLTVSLFRRFFALAQSIHVEQGSIASVDFTLPLCALLIAIVFGCFIFMWNVRSGDDE
jgi:hypothetical protein